MVRKHRSFRFCGKTWRVLVPYIAALAARHFATVEESPPLLAQRTWQEEMRSTNSLLGHLQDVSPNHPATVPQFFARFSAPRNETAKIV